MKSFIIVFLIAAGFGQSGCAFLGGAAVGAERNSRQWMASIQYRGSN
jgi:uncharacterized membrane protein YhiD involved in acid resistance